MAKYITVKSCGIVVRISKTTDVEGYTEGIIESFLPDEDKISDEECTQWIKENNNRMEEICKFMNENDL